MKNFYLIGLTGNLASGKSTIRRQLEQLGALGIDADALAHQAMRRGSGAWSAIVGDFGLGILNWNGEINREKLGALVFADPRALKRLERILHPAVSARIKEILRNTNARVVVIEAIKLIETGLNTRCDAVWVVTSKPEIQIDRVARERHMSLPDARARLDAQGSIDEKLKFAAIVIDNSGNLEATRTQVKRAWGLIQPKTARDKTTWLYGAARTTAPPTPVSPPPRPEPARPAVKPAPPPSLEIRRAHKSDLDMLAAAFAKREKLSSPLARAETLRRFGAHGYRIAVSGERIVAFVAWEAENLVAIAREMWAESAQAADAVAQLLKMIEDEAKQLRCEVLLVAIDQLAPPFVIEQARTHDYQPRSLQELHPIWRQVATDRVHTNDHIWVKLLRKDLVTQPF